MSIKAILSGIVVIWILDTISGIALIPLFADDMSEETLKNLLTDTDVLLFSLFFGSLSTVVGGYIAARAAKDAIYLNSGMIGVFGTVIGFLVASEFPLWFNVASLVSTLPSALFGAYLASPRQIIYA